MPPRPSQRPQPRLVWTDLDRRAVDTCRVLAMDAVERVGNGHPGTAMSLAPAAYLLFQRHLRHDPSDPGWAGRDRFVLSMGHSSLTLYLQLFLSGYGLELDDLKALRTWGSRTPGHPEWGHTAGVETTTGPLGQGLANGVGMALAQRRVRGLLDPEAPAGASPFDWTVWVLASDGDMQEGISAEASSLAGTQRLGNLARRLGRQPDLDRGRHPDRLHRGRRRPLPRPTAGTSTRSISLPTATSTSSASTPRSPRPATEPERPTFIRLRIQIAWPAPNAANTGGAHGSALGADEVAATKRVLGFDPTTSRSRSTPRCLQHARARGSTGGSSCTEQWRRAVRRLGGGQPASGLRCRERLAKGQLPDDWRLHLPTFETGGSVATRSASGKTLAALADVLPELWGGSADLGGSNNTTMPGQPSALPRRPTDGHVVRPPVRPHPALRRPRARHGRASPTGSRWRDTPARTSAPSSSSATTCGPRSGWPP